MEPLTAVLAACRAKLSNIDQAYLAAERIDAFIPIGKGWSLVAAVNQGDDHLVIRLGQQPLYDSTSRLLRLHDFNKALTIAAALGDIDMANTLVSSVPNVRVTTAIGVAARYGELGFLKWLFGNFFDACWGGNEMTKATRFGQFNTLVWLQYNTTRLGPQRLLPHAARHLSPDILYWVLDTRQEQPELSDLIVATEHGRLDNLEILAARVQPPPRIPAHHAARHGHLHIVQWLDEQYGVFDDATMDAAAQNGHLDIMMWLRDHHSARCTPDAFILAALSGQLNVIQWLFANFPRQVSPGALLVAINSGNTKVAQWMHEKIKINWQGNLVECATRHGSRELVTWTMDRFPDQCTPVAMDNAALAGNRELFISLHHAGKTCTTDAIDHFAAQGDLTMVRWAFRERMRCSSHAMEEAAANGHLEVVDFLIGKGQPSTSAAIDAAATNGHLNIIEWLYTNRPQRASVQAMDDAAFHGHYDVVKWLHEHGAACSEYAMDAAVGQGHFEIVILLHRERTEGCSRRASVWAADYGHLEILQCLRINYPTKFDTNATIRAAPTHGWDTELLQDLCNF